ncbi:MAG TPA: FGGY-family carbohydrate kinase, partial [Chthoniobacterales bacterium]
DAIRLRAQLDERTIQQRTGCMLRTSFWPAKLAWLRRTQPRCFGCVARWVSPAEWIFEKCFGTRACSHSMASGTGLYDLDQHDWDEELLAISCLTRTQLGPLSDRDEIEGAAIFPALGDGAASNLGSGATRPGFIAINVGTSAAVRTIPPNDAPLPFGLFKFVVDRDRDLLGGAISNAGNLRAWSLRELRLPNDNPAVERLLRKGMKNPAPLTLLPFLVGERAPSWPENLSGTFVGLTQATTATDLLVAAIQSATFRLADILLTLEGAVGRAKTIIVSGGILQSRASLQILADSLGRDLTICADQEASLRGAAVHALEQLGRKPAAPKFAQRVRHDRARSAKAREDRARQNSLEALLARWD